LTREPDTQSPKAVMRVNCLDCQTRSISEVGNDERARHTIPETVMLVNCLDLSNEIKIRIPEMMKEPDTQSPRR
jgi:hypothetical protein